MDNRDETEKPADRLLIKFRKKNQIATLHQIIGRREKACITFLQLAGVVGVLAFLAGRCHTHRGCQILQRTGAVASPSFGREEDLLCWCCDDLGREFCASEGHVGCRKHRRDRGSWDAPPRQGSWDAPP
jgi:hypothetical protein